MLRPPRPVNMTLNLAPMVDVMMCLIIFFLLASKLVTAERQPLELPVARTAEQFDPSGLKQRVVINVRPSAPPAGEPTADNEGVSYVVIDWDGRTIVERLLAPEDIAPLLAGRSAQARQDSTEASCVIRADRRVPYRVVQVVMKAAAQAGIRKLVFSADIAEGERAAR